VSVIYLLHDILFVTPTCAAIISRSVSPLDSHSSVSSSPIAVCLSVCTSNILAMLSHFFFKDSPNLAFVCFMPSSLCVCSHLIGLILLQTLMILLLLLLLLLLTTTAI
jgi:hypothetical protein